MELPSSNNPAPSTRKTATPSPSRKALTLLQRMDVIKKGEAGKSSRQLAHEFCVGRTQIQSILKRKAEIIAEFEADVPLSKKRNPKPTGNEPINQLCLKWFLEGTQRGISINGPMIKGKALQFASELNISTFSASNGWLESFLKRNQLKLSKFCLESDNTVTCHEWMRKLSSILAGYEAHNVYNLYESGLFYKTSSDKSFYLNKGQKCSDGKKCEERLTIALCASLAGEKEPAFIIGKPAKPGDFDYKLNSSSLPIVYTRSRKSWMTAEIFMSWLNGFNAKMSAQNRHVLLFLNNTPCHPAVTHTNVKLVFFPTATTSIHPPLDQGVIQTLKLQYRKSQFSYLMAEMEADKGSTGAKVMKKVSMLNAVYWLAKAWNAVEPLTIQKGFAKAGFSNGNCTTEDERSGGASTAELETAPAFFNELSQSLVGLPFAQIVEIDNKLATSGFETINWEEPATEIWEMINDLKNENDESEDEDKEENSMNSVSNQEAFKALSILRAFVQQNYFLNCVDSIDIIERDLLKFVQVETKKLSDDFLETNQQ